MRRPRDVAPRDWAHLLESVAELDATILRTRSRGLYREVRVRVGKRTRDFRVGDDHIISVASLYGTQWGKQSIKAMQRQRVAPLVLNKIDPLPSPPAPPGD